MNKVDIAILGYGTVGSGVVEVIRLNQAGINHRAGHDIHIKYVLDLRDFPDDPIQEKIVHDYEIIVNDPDIKVVVEVMGGVHPAFEFVKRALCAGKSVVTSNKELVARHGAELLEIARENSINFFYEASVGGGIPIIRPLYSCLTADAIDEVSGILNGTTNYILSKMTFEGLDFDTVLKEAQQLGYAERNPEADVEGHDAGRKIAILSSMVSEKQVNFEDIYMEGITKISKEDIAYAKAMNRAIKLLAKSRLENGQMYAMVAPFLLSPAHPLYSVNGVFNAIFVHGNVLGDAMFYGSGAGKLPTASAVVSDVVDAVKHFGKSVVICWTQEKKEVADIQQFVCASFVRVPRKELEKAKEVLEATDIIDVNFPEEVGLLTASMSEAEFARRSEQISVISRIRLDERR